MSTRTALYRYHGWLYNTQWCRFPAAGQQRAEKNRPLPTCPGGGLGGLTDAYFGPQPVPLVPRCNFLVSDGGVGVRYKFKLRPKPVRRQHGLMDPRFTHGGACPDIMSTGGARVSRDRVGRLQAHRKTKEPGLLNYREHHLLMPGISCGGSGGRYLSGQNANTPVSAARWSVPIDDTHTLLMRVRFKPADNPGKYEGDPFSKRWKPPQQFIVPYKEYMDSDNRLDIRSRRCISSKTAWWWTACRRSPTVRMKTWVRPSMTG
jgi:hypothetical protein